MKDQAGKTDFLRFLNRNYYIASHLIERLDELKTTPPFLKLNQTITLTVGLLELQLSKIDELFNLLKSAGSVTECEPLIIFLESVFTNIQADGNLNPCIAILDYVSIADLLMEKTAKLAEYALAQMPSLNLATDSLYDTITLQSLKLSLEENCLTS